MSLSLRSFHLFFIAASVVLAAWVGVWGIQSWQANRSGSDLAVGLLFFALGVVLLIYGLRVRRKLRAIAPDEED
jgi:steroid 5-alpha reductase family enzyme